MNFKLDKEILRLAVPNIISNISVPLLSTVDTILMGNLSSLHLAAIGLGSMIFNIVYWNFGFLRMGTTGMTAQAYGADNKPNMWMSLIRSGLLSILIASILLLLQVFIYKGALLALNASDSTSGIVLEYFNVRIWAAPATLLLMVLMGWFFGMQNSIYPLILTVIINIANIGLSYYFVVIKGLEAAGVAWGTVLAQYIGVFVGLFMIGYKYKDIISWKIKGHVLEITAFKAFLRVNTDLFIRTVFLTFVFGFFYSQSSKISDTLLAVNVVLMQFVNWMSYGIDGFAYASEALVGKYKGAKNKIDLVEVIKKSFIWGGAVSLLYSAVYFLFPKALFQIFSDDPNLLEFGASLLKYMVLFPILAFASYIWDGVFVGLTATRSMRNAMFFALASFLILFYILPRDEYGSHIWIAMLSFMVARAFFQWIYWKKYGVEME